MFTSFLLALALTASVVPDTQGFAPCPDGQTELTVEMSVEFNVNIYCVNEPICVAENSNGNCPGAQDGLPYGAYCGIVKTGVYGCKEVSAENPTPTETPAPTSTDSQETDLFISPAPTPNATDVPSTAPVVTNVPTTAPTTTVTPIATNCAPGSAAVSVSVQGVESDYCAVEPVCVAENAAGACPGAQDGLPYGSYCSLIETGVYGCKPYTDVDQPTTRTFEAPWDCSTSPAGDIPVSIVGAMRTYCAPSPACAGSVLGNCPGVQDGLLEASHCALIGTGVYGCVFMTDP